MRPCDFGLVAGSGRSESGPNNRPGKRAPGCAALHLECPTQSLSLIPHQPQSIPSPITGLSRSRIKPNPVVADFKDDVVLASAYADRDVVGGCVLHGIGQGFTGNGTQPRFHRRRQWTDVVEVEVDLCCRQRAQPPDRRMEECSDPGTLLRWVLELVDGGPGGIHGHLSKPYRIVEEFLTPHGLCHHIPLAELQLHQHTGQMLRKAMVNLSGHAPAFFRGG